ncbi:hypothetical protein EDB85DRAFT_411221 [Lactarius pseudohatsudake]|nr:hypothetical protein EDB85DRAFT_411221 [Lactarius pseudohatsudake]
MKRSCYTTSDNPLLLCLISMLGGRANFLPSYLPNTTTHDHLDRGLIVIDNSCTSNPAITFARKSSRSPRMWNARSEGPRGYHVSMCLTVRRGRTNLPAEMELSIVRPSSRKPSLSRATAQRIIH